MTAQTAEATEASLKEYDRSQLKFRTRWRLEVLGRSIWTPGPQISPAYEIEHSLNLREETVRCWTEAFEAYTYGLFQSSALLASIVVELLVEMFLRSKDLFSDYETQYPDVDRRTFGTLIRYCEAEKLVTPKILEKLRRIRDIRNEAAHMSIRRNLTLRVLPTEEGALQEPYNKIDEIEKISVRTSDEKGPLHEAIFLPNEPVLIDTRDNMVYQVRAFKKYALEAVELTDEISHLLRDLY
jgi:hypothetical protein